MSREQTLSTDLQEVDRQGVLTDEAAEAVRTISEMHTRMLTEMLGLLDFANNHVSEHAKRNHRLDIAEFEGFIDGSVAFCIGLYECVIYQNVRKP